MRTEILRGCRACPAVCIEHENFGDNWRAHIATNHRDVHLDNWGGLLCTWGHREYNDNQMTYTDVQYDQPWEDGHHEAIIARTEVSIPDVVTISVLHGCVACPDRNFDKRAINDVRNTAQTSLEQHVKSHHPGVKDWRGMWYKWGKHVWQAGTGYHIEQEVEFGDYQLDSTANVEQSTPVAAPFQAPAALPWTVPTAPAPLPAPARQSQYSLMPQPQPAPPGRIRTPINSVHAAYHLPTIDNEALSGGYGPEAQSKVQKAFFSEDAKIDDLLAWLQYRSTLLIAENSKLVRRLMDNDIPLEESRVVQTTNFGGRIGTSR